MEYTGDQESHDPSLAIYGSSHSNHPRVSRTYDRPTTQRDTALTFGDVLDVIEAVGLVEDGPTIVKWDQLASIVEPPARRHAARPGERLRDRLKREHDELSTALSVIAAKLARREDQLAHLARYPSDDPFHDGTVLRFEKKFPSSEQRYTYVATKIDGQWYLTGKRSPQGIDWDALVDFMGLGVDEVWHLNAGRNGRTRIEKKVIG